MESSSRQFVCDECGVLFTKNKSLLRHVRTVHQGMKRIDSEKRKADNEKRKSEKKRKAEKRKSDSQEIAKIAKINNSAAEDTIPEESTPAEDIVIEECTDNVTEDKVSEDKPANTRYKYHLKAIPESVICFDFVGDGPETEDLKIMVEDCFEGELIRACIIDRSLVIVESGSKKRYTEEELTDWMGNREVKLMQEGKSLGQHAFDYLGNSLDCFEIICLGPLSVRDVFKEAYNVKYNLV